MIKQIPAYFDDLFYGIPYFYDVALRLSPDKTLRQAVDKLDSPDYNHSLDRTLTALH